MVVCRSIQVLLPLAVDKAFDYNVPEEWEQHSPLPEVGHLVQVPFRSKSVTGVVWSLEGGLKDGGKTLKNIECFASPTKISPENLTFISKVSRYNLAPLGAVCKMLLGPLGNTKVGNAKKARSPKTISAPPQEKLFSYALPHFEGAQLQATKALKEAATKGEFAPFLLDGVTGSGKTEVYLAAVEAALLKGKQVLVLLPEIALTSQFLARFEKHFGMPPDFWHSGITPATRLRTWKGVAEGQIRVVVGARSALFLPFQDLGLIVVDEEHDGSYKQEEQVIYHARDMAVLRAQLSQIPVVLVSATPSLESVANVERGRYQALHLRERHGSAQLPQMNLIDMRGESHPWFSGALQTALQETLAVGEQAILYLNRRGYAPLTLCRTCGHRLMCLLCTAWLVEHRFSESLQCHHCGNRQKKPLSCPECHEENSLIPCGPGVERVEEHVKRFFPQASTRVVASDVLSSPLKTAELLNQILNREIDILIGTQILAKGHHFPLLTLVGVIDADLGLSGGDLRACEKTYQLLHQVSGRAGRAEHPGKVLLQTYCPTHPVMLALVDQDRDCFLKIEAEERQKQEVPPYGRFVALVLSGLHGETVERAARQLGRVILGQDNQGQVEVWGPAPAPLALLRGRTRWRFLVKASRSFPIQDLILSWVQKANLPSTVRLTIDVDPYNFL